MGKGGGGDPSEPPAGGWRFLWGAGATGPELESELGLTADVTGSVWLLG